jgi:hypothetical protein
MTETALVPIDNAPAQIQQFADALVEVSCCTPVIAGVRNYNLFGNDTMWEIEIVHELVAYRDDGHPYRHGRRTVCRIASFDG